MNIEEKNKLFESLNSKFKEAGFSDDFTNSIIADIKEFVNIVENKINNIIKNNEKIINEQLNKLIIENKKLKQQNKNYQKLVEKTNIKSKNIINKSRNVINKITELVNESITSMSINYNEKLLEKNVKIQKLYNLLKSIEILESKKRNKDIKVFNEKINKIINKVIPKIVKETIEYTKKINNKKYIQLKNNILEKINDYINNYLDNKDIVNVIENKENKDIFSIRKINKLENIDKNWTVRKVVSESKIDMDKIKEIDREVNRKIDREIDKNWTIRKVVSESKIKEDIKEQQTEQQVEQKKINAIMDLSSPTQIYVNNEVLNESVLTESELNNLIKNSMTILNENEHKELVNAVNKEKNTITKSRFKQLVEKIKSDFENKYMTELANNMTSYDISVVSEIINNDDKSVKDLVDIVAEQLKQNMI